MIHITLKDGSVKEFEAGVSVIDVAKSLGAGLAKAACCGRINGEVADLRTPITASWKSAPSTTRTAKKPSGTPPPM